jgi:uncharacterized protein
VSAGGVTGRAVAVTVAFLVSYAIVRTWVIPGDAHVVANVAATGALAVIAAWSGLTADELGLARWSSGLRVGGVAVAVVGLVLIVAAAVPATRGYFDDDRVDVGAGEMLVRVLVVIPVGTVVFEELAFRGVLLALLRRRAEIRIAIAWSAIGFGLWHVPALVGDDGPAAIAGTVLATTAAGIGFAWLRLRSGSLLAPMLAHLATNSGAFAVAWVVQA